MNAAGPRPRGWRISALTREAMENLTAPGSRLFPLALLCVFTAAALAVNTHVERSRLDSELADLRAEGWNTVTLVAEPDPAHQRGIDADSCAHLSRLDGVRAAGGLEYTTARPVPQLGGSPSALTLVDWRLTGQELTPTAFLGADIARLAGYPERLRVKVGSQSVLANARPMTYPLTSLDLSASVVLSVGFGPRYVANCVVVLEDWAVGTMSSEVLNAVNVNGTPPAVVSGNSAEHPYDRFTERTSRWFPLFAGLLLGLVSHFVNRARASEYAVYRLAGTSRVDAWALGQFELGMVSGLYFLSGVAGLAVLDALDPIVVGAWPMMGLGALALLVVSSLLRATNLSQQIQDALKDR